MKFSKAKCEYIVDRIEELRNVKGGYINLSDGIMFVFDNNYTEEHLFKEIISIQTMSNSIDELVNVITKRIDNNWLDLIKKS